MTSSPNTPTASRRSPTIAAPPTGPTSRRSPACRARTIEDVARKPTPHANAVHGHLRHGPHPARRRGRERADAGQPAAAARQHRQAGRGRLPGARPLERPGPAHGRHHREAGARAARQARRNSTASSPPRHEGLHHRQGLREDDRGRGEGLHRARRQLRPRRARPASGSRRRGASCGSPSPSPPNSTAATSSMARSPTCCPASAGSRSTSRPPAPGGLDGSSLAHFHGSRAR